MSSPSTSSPKDGANTENIKENLTKDGSEKIGAQASTSTSAASKMVSWGSTTGKLYLDDERLEDPSSRGVAWKKLLGKSEAKHEGGEKDT
jgi:hypothetical protein